ACQGHQAWIGGTGDIILTIVPGLEPEFSEPGHLLFLHPGDEKSRVINAEYDYAHPNASRDGRFFVSDTYRDKLVVVGSIKTGNCRVLCETGSTFRGNQWTHPHPYFTPDRKWVIFNSDRTGTPQVYAASVPEGLLEELD
ncbi:MAG: oligogalacturonate lyase family protein, partial [Armatimonadia bacterium]